MALYEDYKIELDGWVNLNAELGIPIGTPLRLINTSTSHLRFVVTSTQPPISVSGDIISSSGNFTPYIDLLIVKSPIWVMGLSVKFSIVDYSDRVPAFAPIGIYTGTRAITSQGYVEANIKNGLQFYLRASWPLSNPISSGDTKNIYFKTGSKKVLIKTRLVHYIAEEMEVTIFEGVTLTPATGTPLVVGNYNKVNPSPTTVTIIKDGTFTGGEAFDSESEYYYGAGNTPQRGGTSIPEGRERVLPEYTEFVVTFKNTGSGNARFSYFLDWYEGDPDLPVTV